MPTKSLPSNPSLEHLKYQARDLLNALNQGNAEAVARARKFHPKFTHMSDDEIRAAKHSLANAQLIIAREYGFESWPKLKHHVEGLTQATSPLGHRYLEVTVHIDQTNFVHSCGNQSDVASRRHLWDAVCIIGPQKWSIKNTFPLNAEHLCFCDGTNVYCTTELVRDDPALAEAFKGRYGAPIFSVAEFRAQNIRHLTITPGVVPLDDFGAGLPWFAFCSGPYLREPGRLVPMGGGLILHQDTFGYRDETITFSDELGLPRDATFYVSHELLKSSPRHPGLRREGRSPDDISTAVNSSVGVPDGFIAARYKVNEFTNISGWSIPTAFEYTRYRFGQQNNSFRTLVAHGQVTGIAPAERPNYFISERVRYHVLDYRFRHPTKLVDYISYEMTNGLVPAPSDQRLQSIYESRVTEAPLDPLG